MSDLHSINSDQRLYVLKCGDGVSCLGFDVAEKRRVAYLKWAGKGDLGLAASGVQIGTEAAYAAYLDALNAARVHSQKTGARCDAELTPALIGLEGKRVEVTTPGGEVSRFYVGKSTGWSPIHLEIETRRASGGGAAYVPPGSTVKVIGTR